MYAGCGGRQAADSWSGIARERQEPIDRIRVASAGALERLDLAREYPTLGAIRTDLNELRPSGRAARE